MSSRRSSPPFDLSSSDGNVRKRVGKACDRCRLKKSKCDGGNPCGRCKADNAICVFGERKKTQDKVYPKGYVEMLEQQQTQLVCGLQELYRIIITGEEWPGRPLKKSINGHPLTHDILDGIGCLTQEGLADDLFEENLTLVQQRLLSQGVENMDRVVGSSDSSSSGSHSPGSTSQRLSVGDIFSNDTFVPPSSDFRPYSTSQSSSNPHVSQTSQVLQQIQQQRQQQTRAQEQQFQEAQSQMDTSPQLFYPTHTTAPDMHPYSSWAQLSGNGLDDVPTSLDVLDPSFDLDCLQRTAAQLSRQMPNAGTNLSLPPPQVDFTEDDFNLFLNTNPGPPRV